MSPAVRIAIFGLTAFAALAGAAGAAVASGPAHSSVGFEPIPLSVAADGAGHVYLSNPLASTTVEQYSNEGKLLADVGDFDPTGSPFAPRDIATDAVGNLYVADGPGAEISVWTPGGEFLRRWDTRDGRDLAVGPDGSVYLATSYEIQRYSAEGALLGKWGGSALKGGLFGEVWGIDTSPSGRVYVADTWGSRIYSFTAEGALLGEWSHNGGGRGRSILPYGIAVGAGGDVYIADTANNRVDRFSADGAFLGGWGGPGRAHGRFYTPTSVTADPAGYVYVADSAEPYPAEGLARVQKFTADGQFVTQWYDSPPRITPGRPRLWAGVGRRTRKRSAAFRFRSRASDLRFVCRLSGEEVPRKLTKWRRCTSPKRYSRLRPGRKTFHVRAVSGTAPGHEARFSWLVIG